MTVDLRHGDCLEVMPRLGAEGQLFDACITDPPYHLTSIVSRFGSLFGKPPAASKDASFERLSKGFMGQQWDGGDIAFRPETWRLAFDLLKPGAHFLSFAATRNYHRMAVAIEDAGFEIRDIICWHYGSGFPKRSGQLKPATEPICVARKPLIGTVAKNVAEFGTGALNIGGCRVGLEILCCEKKKEGVLMHGGFKKGTVTPKRLGRWPANLCHDGSAEIVEQMGDSARFFYCAKASRKERWGTTHPTVKPFALMRWLVRLVTPPGGVILDPFAGSGTTGIAAAQEGFGAVLIEREARYAAEIRARLHHFCGIASAVDQEPLAMAPERHHNPQPSLFDAAPAL